MPSSAPAKLAEEEEEKRVAAEATAALEKAKASGFTYGEEEPTGASRTS